MPVRRGVTPKPVTNNAPIPFLVTRPRAQGESFVQGLPAGLKERLAPILSPLIDILPLHAAVSVGPGDGAIFTSTNGVALAPKGQGQPAWCVGPATTHTAEQAGWDAVMAGATSDELVARLSREAPGKLWHLAGVHTRGNVSERLNNVGHEVQHIPLYDQATPDLSKSALTALRAPRPCIVTLFSPRTARLFHEKAPEARRASLVALSDAIADEIHGRTEAPQIIVAHRPDADGMILAIEKALQNIDMG